MNSGPHWNAARRRPGLAIERLEARDLPTAPTLLAGLHGIGGLGSSTPGISAIGALLRVPALAPKILPYQAWLFAISASGRKKWTCSLWIGIGWSLFCRISMRRPSGVLT